MNPSDTPRCRPAQEQGTASPPPLLPPALRKALPMIALVQEFREVVLPDGRRAAVLDYAVPDDAPPLIKEGIARRRVVNGGGACPCGAKFVLPNRAMRRRGGVTLVPVPHADDCPADTETLRA